MVGVPEPSVDMGTEIVQPPSPPTPPPPHRNKVAPRSQTGETVYGHMVGVPEPSVDMGMLIVRPLPPPPPK